MDRSIDVDELWRVAARKLQASPLPPRDLHVEGLCRLACALQSEGRYDARALRLLQREIFAWILSYLSFCEDQTLYPGLADVPV